MEQRYLTERQELKKNLGSYFYYIFEKEFLKLKQIAFSGYSYTCCKNCDHRYPKCHDECKDYLEIKAKNDELRENVRRKNDSYSYSASKHHNKNLKDKARGRLKYKSWDL